jgi:hypothetical protein
MFFKEKHRRVMDEVLTEYKSQYPSMQDQHRLLFTAIKDAELASGWKIAIPNPSRGQRFSDIAFNAVARFQLGIPLLTEERRCDAAGCNGRIDIFGYHALACCGVGNFRKSRHEMLLGALSELAREAGFGIRVNPSESLPSPVRSHRPKGQSSSSKQVKGNCKARKSYARLKPADLMIADDRQVVIDVTIVSPFCKSHMPERSERFRAVDNAANGKVAKYNKACVENGLDFMPFAADVCGTLQSDASGFVQRLADSIASRTGSALSLSVSFVRQRLSCALFRAVAMQLVPLLVEHVHPTLFNDPLLHSVDLGSILGI